MKIIGWIKLQYWLRGHYMLRVKQFLCGFTRHKPKPIACHIARCEKCNKYFDIKREL